MINLLNTLRTTLKMTYESGVKAGFEEGVKRAVELMTLSSQVEAGEGLSAEFINDGRN